MITGLSGTTDSIVAPHGLGSDESPHGLSRTTGFVVVVVVGGGGGGAAAGAMSTRADGTATAAGAAGTGAATTGFLAICAGGFAGEATGAAAGAAAGDTTTAAGSGLLAGFATGCTSSQGFSATMAAAGTMSAFGIGDETLSHGLTSLTFSWIAGKRFVSTGLGPVVFQGSSTAGAIGFAAMGGGAALGWTGCVGCAGAAAGTVAAAGAVVVWDEATGFGLVAEGGEGLGACGAAVFGATAGTWIGAVELAGC